MIAALTQKQIEASKPVVSSTKGLARFIRVSFTNVVLNPFNLGFAFLMPILMYLMFGANQSYSDQSVGNGNIAAEILVSMTLFGVLLSTSSFAANVSLERTQGVSRLYALTPLSAPAQLVGRMTGILGVGVIVIATVFTVGFFTGASMTGWAWIQSVLLVLAVSVVGVSIGFGCGFAVRSDAAFAAVSAVIVLSAFGAGMTMPLEMMGEFFQDLAPWTPLWGALSIARLPLFGWADFTPNMVVNMVAWTGLFCGLAVWGLRRDTGR